MDRGSAFSIVATLLGATALLDVLYALMGGITPDPVLRAFLAFGALLVWIPFLATWPAALVSLPGLVPLGLTVAATIVLAFGSLLPRFSPA
jgi:hypothetical protein